MDWDQKWFLDFNAGKTQLVLLDLSNNTGAINLLMRKWMGLFLRKNQLL